MDKNQHELVYKLGAYEQHIQQIHQQLQLVEQGMVELSTLSMGLDNFYDSKDKEMLANIGRGIFIKTKILSEELIVDVGNKNFAKKTIKETQKMIEKQTKRLEEAKKELNNNLEKINEEISKLILEAQK